MRPPGKLEYFGLYYNTPKYRATEPKLPRQERSENNLKDKKTGFASVKQNRFL